MNTTIAKYLAAATVFLTATFAYTKSAAVSTFEKERAELLARFDLNGNGKIDVSERKPYVREVARRAHAEEKRLAAMRPKLSNDERLFMKPANWSPAKTAQYDANKDGKLDRDELMKERQDAAEAARAEFKKADTNGNGRLDPAERQAVSAMINTPTTAGPRR